MKLTFLLLSLLLNIGPVVSTTFSQSIPYRPMGKDLSLKWADDGSSFNWCGLGTPNVHTCSQYERDVKEWTLVRYAMDITEKYGIMCPQEEAFTYSPSAMNAIFPRLGWPYEARDLRKQGGGLWVIGNPIGHHYAIERNVLQRFQSCLKSNKNKELARLVSTKDERDLLDANDTFTGPAAFSMTFPGPTVFDNQRSDYAPVDSRPFLISKLQSQTNRENDLIALHATHKYHKQNAEFGCGSTVPSASSVKEAHLLYESMCPPNDEECLHFRAMKPFKGTCDSRWTEQECCTWKKITDVYHQDWTLAQVAGKWGDARRADSDHNTAHTCMNNADRRLLVIFSCESQLNATQQVPNCVWPNGKRGKMSCRDFLAVLPITLKIN